MTSRKSRGWAGEGARSLNTQLIMYYIIFSPSLVFLSLSLSPPSPPSLLLSLPSPSLTPSLLPSLPLPFTDRLGTQTTAVHENKTNKNKCLPGDQGSSGTAEVMRKVLREVLNCERELLCRMWGGRLFQTRGA